MAVTRARPAMPATSRSWEGPATILLLAALVAWAAAPVVYELARAVAHHETFTGADGLFAGDQLQYLSWIRSSGEHWLAADDFTLAGSGNVFLHPMFFISGLLSRAGVGVTVSYLVWLPVATVVLFVGFRRYVQQTVTSAGARLAALALSLFFVTPADPLVGWTSQSTGLEVFGGEMSPASVLWGYLPVVIAIGLMPLFALHVAKALSGNADRGSRWHWGWAAATGLLVSWLHPWQGETLLAVTLLLLAANRFRRTHWPLVVPAAATAIPLGYYFILSKTDGGWQTAQEQTPLTRPSVVLLLVALAPLAAFAVVGARKRFRATEDQVLVLWVLAALLIYFVFATSDPPHALDGLSLPLAVLAVRGYQRLNWRRSLGVVGVVLATVPGLLFTAHLFHDAASGNPQGFLLTREEHAALTFLSNDHTSGGVLAPLRIAAAVPAYAGRRTWVGHPIWTPGYSQRARLDRAIFSGGLSPRRTQSALRHIGARFVFVDCESRLRAAALGSLLEASRKFGCVAVYQLKTGQRTASL